MGLCVRQSDFAFLKTSILLKFNILASESSYLVEYGKFGNFRENFFAKSVKRHICGVKNSLLWHDLPISINDRVISPFREDFVFTVPLSENKTLAIISDFTVPLR